MARRVVYVNNMQKLPILLLEVRCALIGRLHAYQLNRKHVKVWMKMDAKICMGWINTSMTPAWDVNLHSHI